MNRSGFVMLLLCAVVPCSLPAGCFLRGIGDPGEPLLTFALLAEDAAILPSDTTAAAWRTDDGLHFAASRDSFGDRLDVFEAPPDDDVAATRLDFFMGAFDDFTRLAEGRPAVGALARSRAQLWWIHDVEAVGEMVPALVASRLGSLDAQPVPAVLLVDSGDPAARRCGDSVLADRLPGCADCAFDGAVAADEDACCTALRAEFDACRAVVPDGLNEAQTLPVRLRVLSP
jgi:hypothetical protein